MTSGKLRAKGYPSMSGSSRSSLPPAGEEALQFEGSNNVGLVYGSALNATTGAIEAVPWKGQGIALNEALHAND